jgi:hypothetical protein
LSSMIYDWPEFFNFVDQDSVQMTASVQYFALPIT